MARWERSEIRGLFLAECLAGVIRGVTYEWGKVIKIGEELSSLDGLE